MTKLKPTDEQQEILDAFEFGGDLVIEAGAGTGKTSTLKLIGQSTRERGLYLAFNAAVKTEARATFPRSVTSHSSHSLAYKPIVVDRLAGKQTRGPRQTSRDVAQILDIRGPLQLGSDIAPRAPQQLARLALTTVEKFCYSADDEIGEQHVKVPAGLDGAGVREVLVDGVLPWARKAWADITDRAGALRFEDDHYLKMFQLTRPMLRFDYLLVDEAQDLNPAVRALVEGQTHAQIALVGDRNQQLFGWRGAVDAMQSFYGTRLRLTQSFRFGHAIAEEANKWLTLLGTDLRVRGLGSIPSHLAYAARPDAVLCRTNGTALAQVIDGLREGRAVALVGGGAPIAAMARAAIDLKAGRGTDHPELIGFTTWAQVQDFAQEPAGSDLKVFVEMIDRHGPDEIVRVADRLVDPADANLTVATVHKVKGLEWPTVAIADDFREPVDDEHGLPGQIPPEDAMLAYVAVTRAKLHLDRGGLSWVDRHHQWAEVGRPEDDAYASILTVRPGWRPALPEETPGECEPELAADEPIPAPPGPAPTTTAAMDRLRAAVAVAEQLQKPDGSDLQVDQLVRYRSDPTSAFTLTVKAIRPSLGVGWVVDLEQRDGKPQRSINVDLLEPVPDGYGPVEAFGWPLAPNCRRCALPYLDCSCPIAPDRRTDEQVSHAA